MQMANDKFDGLTLVHQGGSTTVESLKGLTKLRYLSLPSECRSYSVYLEEWIFWKMFPNLEKLQC
jgi:hypothetical protein